ncbi:hypothetical protein NDA01_20020 [Trichocoleus desertorum AS-A10]|uniref:hypothetical protein n=1 Tax=Trichocoleus desertorum TaxID=1481672 RepID=UPI00329A5B14
MILITYDLKNPGQKYQKLTEAIQALGPNLHCLLSTWLVETNLSPEQVTQNLIHHIDDNDRLLVVTFDRYTSWGWLTQSEWQWIHKTLGIRR